MKILSNQSKDYQHRNSCSRMFELGFYYFKLVNSLFTKTPCCRFVFSSSKHRWLVIQTDVVYSKSIMNRKNGKFTHLRVWAVFVSLFSEEILIGNFFFFTDEFSFNGWFWLNCTVLRDRITKLPWSELLAELCWLFLRMDRVFAYSRSS